MFARKVSMHLKVDGGSRIQEENGERSDSHSAQAGGVPRRNHLPIPQRKRSSCLQSVGERAARGDLQPWNVSRSDQDPDVCH